MKKKVLALLMAGTMAMGMLTGCGGGSSEPAADAGSTATEAEASDDAAVNVDELKEAAAEAAKDYAGGDVDLSFWYLTARQQGTEELTAIWNEVNPNMKMTVSFYDTDGIKDACKTAAQSGSLPSQWFNWGGALGQYYVDNGVTLDLSAYAEAHNWKEEVNPGALDLCTLSGQLAGYPTSYNVLGMFYRTDIFAQYNLEVPTTLDEFTAVCKTLKENGITPISTAGLNGWHVMRIIEQFIEAEAGVEEHNALQGLATSWDNENVVKALETYKMYCEEGYFPAGFVTASPDDTYMALAMGECAMDIQGQWYDATLINNGVDISTIDWFPFPNGTGRMSAFAEMNQLSAKLSEDEIEAVMCYNHFLYGNTAAKYYPTYYNLPLPYSYADPVDENVTPHVMDMYKVSEGGTFTITDQAFPQEVADVLFNNQDAIANGEKEPAAAAKEIQAAIEAYQAK